VKTRNLLESFNCAFEGVIYAFKTQRNVRIHFLLTTLVLVFSLALKVSKAELLILFLTIALVLITEMINTALETVVDLATQEYHDLAAIAKDVAAGAVLVASMVALVVGYLVFFPRLEPGIPMVIAALRQVPAYLTLIALFCTIVAVVAGKALTKTGRPMQGGMPSGHTALGAAAATAIFLLTRSGLISFLAVFMVFLIAESRVENKIHSVGEVLLGGALGFFATLFIFQLLG
jgi:diacylglycerol kinase (ATP)